MANKHKEEVTELLKDKSGILIYRGVALDGPGILSSTEAAVPCAEKLEQGTRANIAEQMPILES